MQPHIIYYFAVLVFVAFSSGSTLGAEPEPSYDGKSLTEWIQQLNDSKDENRRRAAAAIGSLATVSRVAVPALLHAVQENEEGRVNEAAIEALVRIGPDAVPSLLQTLWGDDLHQRRVAIFVLARLGSKARAAIPSLIRTLNDGDPGIRSGAVRALAGIRARSSIPTLIEMLRGEKNVETQFLVLKALLELDVESQTIVPVLVKWLEEGEEVQRLLAARGLGDLGVEGAGAVPALTRAMQEKSAAVRIAVVQTLGRIGRDAKNAIPALTTALQEDDWRQARPELAVALWRIARHASAAPTLKAWLKDDQGTPQARVQAASLLWHIEKSPVAVEVLSEVLTRGTGADRNAAAECLIRIGPDAKAALPAAIALLKHKDRNSRFDAIQVLSRLGEHARPAIQDMEKIAKEETGALRFVALTALWHVEKDRSRIPAIVQMLSDDVADARIAAARLLGEIGPQIQDTIPNLTKLLVDKDGRVRIFAAEAIWRIDNREIAWTAMLELLRDKDPLLRGDEAVRIGATFRAKAASAITPLRNSLWDHDSEVRASAAESIGRIGPTARQAVPALIALLSNDEEEDHVLSAAAEALGLIGPDSKAAVLVLQQRLKHPNWYVRVSAALALWHIDQDMTGLPIAIEGLQNRNYRVRVVAAETLAHLKQPERAVSVLLDVLSNTYFGEARLNGNERYMVPRALGRIGPLAKAAVPALLELLKDEDYDVRMAASKALLAIDPASAGKK